MRNNQTVFIYSCVVELPAAGRTRSKKSSWHQVSTLSSGGKPEFRAYFVFYKIMAWPVSHQFTFLDHCFSSPFAA